MKFKKLLKYIEGNKEEHFGEIIKKMKIQVKKLMKKTKRKLQI